MLPQFMILARGSLGQLNKNITRMGKTLTKVAGGQKRNSVADGASEVAISEKMRQQIRSLGQDQQNVQNGAAMIKTASGGVEDIVDVLREMKKKAVDAANDSNTDEDRATIQKEINQLRSTINDVAIDTQFNGKRLLNGLYGLTKHSEKRQTGWEEPPKEFTMVPSKTYTKIVNADGSRMFIGENNVKNMTQSFKPTNTSVTPASNLNSGGNLGLTGDVGFDGNYAGWNWADAYKDANFTVKYQGPVYFEDTQNTPSTPQQVIKAFMHSLDGTKLRSFDAFDEAINYCTGGTITDKDTLVNQFMNDLNGAATYEDFLRDYCDIDLTNADTGAITGSDAGGGSTKTAESIVPESSSPSSWTSPAYSSLFNGLRVYWPSTGVNGAFSAAEEHILKGLNSEWIQQSLDLVKETYDIDFNATETSVKSISVRFTQEDNNNLAYVTSYASGGKAYNLTLSVNMKYYNDIDTSSEDGKLSSSRQTYLDRVIAHEFTHAVMSANINHFNNLPLYVVEGSAELTHGIDDERGNTIRNLLTTGKSTLQSILTSGGSQSDGANPYAAGYMLLRYLAKQGQGQSISRIETTYNESYSSRQDIPDTGETGVEIDFSGSTMADGSALTVPDSFHDQGFSILCGGCGQYINVVFDKNQNIGTGTLKIYSDGSQRRDYTIGIGDATSTDDLAKAIFEGVKNASGRSTLYDVSVVKDDGTSDTVCVGVDQAHNVRIAKNPNYPADSNSEYVFLKQYSPTLLFMEGGIIDATGGVGSKDDAPAGTETQLLDDSGNEIFDENGNSVPYKQTIKVDTDTVVKIWEPKYETVTWSEGNPLVIHSGTQANQNSHYFINDMQTKSLTTGKIFDAVSDSQKSERTLINNNDRARYESLSNDPDKQKAWIETLKAADNMSIDDISVTTVRDANIAIRVLDGALEYALDNATTLGAYLQRLEYTETNIVTTEENTIASESTIRDADMAKEMTEYTKANILMQSSQFVLAQANQNASGILDLLR